MTTGKLFGPCAKHVTQAVLIGASGRRYVGENVCLNPQATCPREKGEGYDKCKTICRQIGHAEELALMAAGDDANGGSITITHHYACDACRALLGAAGVHDIRFTGEDR